MAPPPLSAIEHYQTFLADHYTWMSGPYVDKVAHQRNLLMRSRIVLGTTREALDLGCGPGAQSVALAELGFSVTAIDANAQLLEELRNHAGNLPIRTVLHDLCALASCSALPAQADVAVCLGDIIPHLPSTQCITTLFKQVSGLLPPHGRIIPIRGDNERIMTCFLEYEPETVIVHDLIYVRQGEGWDLRKSSYRKLRLSLLWVCTQLEAQGFTVLSREQTAGVWTVVASKA